MSIIDSSNFFTARNSRSGYDINQSLRFRGAQKLQRSVGTTGDRRNWTLSVWYKGIKGTGVFLESFSSLSNWSVVAIAPTGSLLAQNRVSGTTVGPNSANDSKYFRDPSAWYHLVVNQNGSTNDCTIYINGSSVLSVSITTNWLFNTSGQAMAVGARTINDEYFENYMAEYHFVDGQVLTPSSFGQTDTITGAWIPKKYSGSYGTNGFYLKFDPSATNGIGHDHSGNGNNFTATGFSTSSSTYNINNDVVFDTPTNNHATWLPGKSDAFMPGQAQAFPDYRQNGNLYGNTGRNSPNSIFSSIPFPDNAKTYVEVYINDVGGGGGPLSPGVSIGCDLNGYGPYIYGSGNYNQDTAAAYSGYDGAFTWNGGSGTSNGGAYGASTLIGIAVDTTTSSPTISFYKNGTLVGTGTVGSNYRKSLVVRIDPVTGSSTAVGAYINAGQYAFNNLPTGYKALNTANLPEPTIKKGSAHFNTVLWTGNAANPRSITGVGFSPDFVWTKKRNAAQDHFLYDAVRGSTNGNFYELRSSSTSAEGVPGTANVGMRSLDSDGFTIGSDASVNTNNDTYVAWAWDAGGAGSSNTAGSITSTVSANASAGFSIVSYQSQTSTKPVTVGHGLGVKPSLIIFFNRISASSRAVYHSALGATKIMSINSDSAATTSADYFNNTEPTSTVFTVNDSTATHNYGSSDSMIAYCFSEVAGYSKFGSYQGNGSSDGPFVFCGFRPAYVWLKGSTFASNWNAYDSARDQYNITDDLLRLNSSAAEVSNYAATAGIDLLSNGFKIRTSSGDWNSSGQTFVFVAFAVLPFKYANAR